MKDMYIKLTGTIPYTHRSHKGFKVLINPNEWIGIPGCHKKDYTSGGNLNTLKYNKRLTAYKEERQQLEKSTGILGPFNSRKEAVAWERKAFPERYADKPLPEGEKPVSIVSKITRKLSGRGRKKTNN